MSRFNLSLLRQLPRTDRVSHSKLSLLVEPQLSRRSFLSLSGAGIAYGALPTTLRGAEFELVREGETVHLTVDGQSRWTIDPSDFGKRARLTVLRDRSSILLRLRSAMFPGTDDPADFDCVLDCPSGEWTLRMSMASGMELSAPLVRWLNGFVPATGQWKATRFKVARQLEVQFRSYPEVQFQPDWTFDVHGESLVVCSGLTTPLPASRFLVAINTAQTLMPVPPRRATTVKVLRDDASWFVAIAQESEQGWSLRQDARDTFFDHLWVEASETESGGSAITALFHQSPENPAALDFIPGKALCTDCGDPVAFPLRNVRLALGLDGGFQSALIADLPEDPVWVHDRHSSYLLAALPDAPGFELYRQEGTESQPRLMPGICEVCFPGTDSCITLKLDHPRPLPFIWGDLLAPFEAFAGWLNLLPSEHGKLAIHLAHGDRLCVERPQDMVSLQFSFENMWLDTLLGAKIVPIKGAEPRILVHFPSQHVAEQAFFETQDTSTGHPTPLPFALSVPIGQAEVDEYNNRLPAGGAKVNLDTLKEEIDPELNNAKDEDDSLSPQVNKAGPSQLVFAPPEGTEIRCHPNALLDWSKWQPIVAPAAKSNIKTASFEQVPEIVDPNPTEGTQYTSIEMPWRLRLSPSDIGRWAHSIGPVESTEKVVELWHTRLGVALKSSAPTAQPEDRKNQKKCDDVKEAPTAGPSMPVDEDNQVDRTARAIWADGFIAPPKPTDLTCAVNSNWASLPDHFSGTPTTNDPFRMSLDFRDRTELVYLTSDYGIAQHSV